MIFPFGKRWQSGQKSLDVDKLFRAEIDAAAALKGPGPTRRRSARRPLSCWASPIPNHGATPMIWCLRCLNKCASRRFRWIQKPSAAQARKMRPEGRIDLHGMDAGPAPILP